MTEHKLCKQCKEPIYRKIKPMRNMNFCSSMCYREYWTELNSEKRRLLTRLARIESEFMQLKHKKR